MNKVQTVRPGGHLKGNFNKMLALVGFGWFSSMLVVRYVIKPWRVENRMKENEKLMNELFDEEIKQENTKEKFDI